MIPLRIATFGQRRILVSSLFCDNDFDSVVLLLHFNGTNNSVTFIDSSSYGRTITNNGDAKISTTESKFNGSSGRFDGNGDYINTNSNADLNLTADFTVECWVYFSSLSNTPHVFQFSGSAITKRWNLYISSSKLTFYSENGTSTGANHIQSSALSTSQWYHIAIVRAGSTFTLYINGSSVGTSTTTVWPNENMSLEIGTQKFTPLAGDWLNGYVADFRITKGVARYTSNFNIPTSAFQDGPCFSFSRTMLLMHFDGANNSTTFTDSSYNRTITVSGNTKISTAQSKFGGASGSFDGIDDYLQIPDSDQLWFGSQSFTIEFWVYLNSFPANGTTLISQESSNDIANAAIDISVNTTLKHIYAYFYDADSSQYFEIKSANDSLATGQWYHVAIARDGGTMRLFLDGIIVSTCTSGSGGKSLTNASFRNVTANWILGAKLYPGYSPFQELNGYLDELRVIKGKAMYTANFTPPTAPFPDS